MIKVSPLSEEQKKVFGKYADNSVYMFESGVSELSYPSIVCKFCGAEIMCIPDDFKYLLGDLENINCPKCGKREDFMLNVDTKHLVHAIKQIHVNEGNAKFDLDD